MHTDPEVLALVALGERDAATPEDLDHIAHCATCGREVDELGHLTSVGRTISDHFTLETPSPEVWDRIRAQLGFSDEFSSELVPPPAVSPTPSTDVTATVPETGGRPAIDDSRPRKHRRRIVSLALAAALVLLAAVGGAVVWQQLRPSETVVSAVPLNALPPWAGSTGEATLEQDADGKRWLVVSMATPRPVDGQREVWLLKRDATDMVSIGNMAESPDRLPVPESVDVSEFPVVDVSDEPADGNPKHSGNSIVRGTLDV
ncbi:MAG TPA: anti-sigma factor [Microlunatus sp.]|nr:anti-sigma factor [Microlunatus sp.]